MRYTVRSDDNLHMLLMGASGKKREHAKLNGIIGQAGSSLNKAGTPNTDRYCEDGCITSGSIVQYMMAHRALYQEYIVHSHAAVKNYKIMIIPFLDVLRS
jgi:hypothetical protein